MMRQLVCLFCFVVVAFLAFIDAPHAVMGANQPQRIAAQLSPLVSPLVSPLMTAEETLTVETAPMATTTIETSTVATTTVATATVAITTVATVTQLPAPAPANGSPISVVLVGAVLLGLLLVISLVVWRRR